MKDSENSKNNDFDEALKEILMATKEDLRLLLEQRFGEKNNGKI